jgi:putative acetyltransferase
MEIRTEEPHDLKAIRALHQKAFERDDESNLVTALRENERFHPEQSIVAVENGMIVGHILFSNLQCTFPDGHQLRAAALAPLAVRPERQNQGIGRALIAAGLEKLGQLAYEVVVVLGEPGYYAKSGFSANLGEKIKCAYSGPNLLALEITPGALQNENGVATLAYPPEFAALS